MKQRVFKVSLLLSAINGVCLMQAGASTVTDKIDYQIFRDFGENKGVFTPGATNIPIYDKEGNLLGTALPKDIPMPDMSASGRKFGVATLVGEQLAVTAQHNSREHLGGELEKNGLPLIFGNDRGQHYQTIDRNDANGDVYTEEEIGELKAVSLYYNDISLPRLNKMVTEVAPTPHFSGDRLNVDDYVAFARTGSGIQGTTDGSNIEENLAGEEGHAPAYTYIDDGYRYLTGGVIPYTEPTTRLSENPDPDLDTQGEYLYTLPFTYYDLATNTLTLDDGTVAPLGVSPLNSASEKGDSGSGLYGYNKKTNRWELVGVVSGGSIYDTDYYLNSDTYTVFDNELLKKVNERYYAGTLDDTYSDYRWAAYGNFSTLSVGDDHRTDIDTDKDLYINHDATITLDYEIDQGSGGIYVGRDRPNSQQTPVVVKLTGDDDASWEGSGLWIGDGSTVILEVDTKGLLPKLGKGVLTIQGKGDGTADDDDQQSLLSLGDGTVILAQRPDQDGNRQAFAKINIVSGRGTLVLGDDKQIPLEDISFGYRGGRLDLNGLALRATHLQHDDDGAQLVNHSDKTAHLTLTGKQDDQLFYGVAVDGKVYDYRSVSYPMHEPDGTDKDSPEWVYLGEGDDPEKRWREFNARAARQKAITVFAGMLGETDQDRPNGELNITYTPQNNPSESTLLLTGGSNLNGTLTATAGTVLLSGRPTTHAVDWTNNEEVIPDDTWVNRDYRFTKLVAQNNANIYAGRNIKTLNANLSASGTSTISLGFENGKTPVCVRSDFHYETNCTTPIYDKAVLQTIPAIDAKGDVRLTDSAALALYRTQLTGAINGDQGTTVSLGQGNWVMTKDSHLGTLTLRDGASITLNPNANPTDYHTLDIDTLTGQGRFNYKTHLADFKGDKVNVKQTLDGQFTLAVADKGGEPTKTKEHLTLLDATNAKRNASTVTLANLDGVSLGAYRYQLQNDNGRYYLASAALELELDQPITTEPETPEQPVVEPEVPVVIEPETPIVPEQPVVVEPEQPVVEQPIDETPVVEPEQPVIIEPEIPVIPQPPEQPVVEQPIDETPVTEPETPIVPEQPVVEPEQPVIIEPEVPVTPEPPKQPVVEQPVDEIPVVVEPETPAVVEPEVPVTETPTNPSIPNDRPRFFDQRDVTSSLTNLSLTDLTQSLQTLGRARNLSLRHLLDDDSDTLWVSASRFDADGKDTPWVSAYHQNEQQLQVGAKHRLANTQGTLTIGAAYTRADGKGDYRGEGYHSKRKLDLGSAFVKQTWGDNTFVALDASYGTQNVSITALGSQTDVKRNVSGVGLTVGKRFASVIDITPSLGVAYDHLDRASYRVGGADVVAPSVGLLSHRAGIGLSKTLTLANGVTLTPTLASHYVKVANGNSRLYVNDLPFVQKYGNHHHHELGVKAGVGGFGVSLEGNYTKGDDHKKQSGTTLKLSYQW